MSGYGMAMKVELQRLAAKHGIADASPRIIPLSSPSDDAMTLSGLASTIDIDLTRQKFRGWAFDNLCILLKGYPFPKLLYKHDPEQPAGEITSLSWDDRGQLLISADVGHERARRCNAFSVCASVLQYEIRNADSADYFALITQARIDEISLTDRPANPNALVRSRYRTPPMNKYLDLLGERTDLSIKAIEIARRQVELIQQIARTPADISSQVSHDATPDRRQPSPIRRAPIVSTPRRSTQFSSLVEAMNAQH